MICLDTILYAVLSWYALVLCFVFYIFVRIVLKVCRYLDAVMPGEYGTAKSPTFCFRPCYWKSLLRTPRGQHSMMDDDKEVAGGMMREMGKGDT